MPLLPGDELIDFDIKREHLNPNKSLIAQIFERIDKIEARLDRFNQDHQALAEIQEVLGKMETGG